jgi:hypothetical protein
MTSARDAVHKALAARIEPVAGPIPVRVAPTAELPYVRIGEDTEGPDAESKRGGGSVVRPIVGVFSSRFTEARETVTKIINDLTDRGMPLAVAGFRVLSVRIENVIPVPEVEAERTIYGERVLLEIRIEPTL